MSSFPGTPRRTRMRTSPGCATYASSAASRSSRPATWTWSARWSATGLRSAAKWQACAPSCRCGRRIVPPAYARSSPSASRSFSRASNLRGSTALGSAAPSTQRCLRPWRRWPARSTAVLSSHLTSGASVASTTPCASVAPCTGPRSLCRAAALESRWSLRDSPDRRLASGGGRSILLASVVSGSTAVPHPSRQSLCPALTRDRHRAIEAGIARNGTFNILRATTPGRDSERLV
mmetsp:Transcript_47906/g.128350  ORF Transcript_47906/g.128350 Transcript_47906/m.128350 type:complete len:234 (+) Transcript_47906:213-914(+)